MKKILFFIFFVFSIYSFAQAKPVQVKFPSENQKKLIDEFMEISNYRSAILNLANIRVFVKSMKHDNGKMELILDDSDRNKVLSAIEKSYSRKDKLYLDFMNLTDENLMSLIEFYKKNKNLTQKNDYLFASGVIFHNLDNEIDLEISRILKIKSQ